MTSLESLRELITCPISLEPMKHPWMVVPCGHSFEEDTIKQIKNADRPCPLCRIRIDSVVSNHLLRGLIETINAIPPDTDQLKRIEELKTEIFQLRQQVAAGVKDLYKREIQHLEESFSSQASPGCYLLAVCTQENCALAGQPVWVNKKIGKFDLNRECWTTNCSLCEQKFNDINTAAVQGFNYQWEGQRATGEKVEKRVVFHELVHDIIPKLSEWRYITVTIFQ